MVFGGVAIGDIGYAADLPAGLGVYVGSTSRTIWRHDGTSWASFTVSTMGATELVESLAVAPEDPNILYALGEDASNNFKIHRSIDGGTTWTLATLPVTQGEMRSATSIWATDASTVFIAFCCTQNASMIWRSLNGGIAWSKVAPALVSGITNNLYGDVVGRMGVGQSKIWIGGDQTDTGTGTDTTYGFHRYDADGANAVHVAYNNKYFQTPSMAAPPDRDDRAWAYWGAAHSDGSIIRKVTTSTSTLVTPHADWGSAGVSALIDMGGATATLIAVAKIGGLASDWAIYRSTNDGATWSKITSTSADYRIPSSSEYGYVLARNPSAVTSDVYYVSDTKIWRSTNAGGSWTDVTAGGPSGGLCIAAGYS